MLGPAGRRRLLAEGPRALFAPDVVEVVGEADLFVLNLECCISDARGAPGRIRASRSSSGRRPLRPSCSRRLGVDCVTLANNHALDYGPPRRCSTRSDQLAAAGIACAGAGAGRAPRLGAPRLLSARLPAGRPWASTDHPRQYAAGPDRPGVAYADLKGGLSDLARSTSSRRRGSRTPCS